MSTVFYLIKILNILKKIQLPVMQLSLLRKIALLSILASLTCLSLFAQSVTITPTSGTYKTGYAFNSTTPTRADDNMLVNFNAGGANKRGWAVFNLASVVPPGATVTAVSLRFTISAVANSADPTISIRGYAGDNSTATSAAVAYSNCAGTGSSLNSTTSFGGTTGTFTTNFNATGISFINSNSTGTVSICWLSTSNAGQTYTITGYSGTASTVPQLTITYTCAGLGTTTATASPNPVCLGSTLSLSGSVTGATTYSWQGPSSFSSTLQNPTRTTTAGSAGIYSFTATNSAGCYYKAVTSSVSVTPAAGAITGSSSVCRGAYTTLSNSSAGGTWTSSNTSVATIGSSSGIAGGGSAGTTTISYTPICGSVQTFVLTVLASPTIAVSPASPTICLGTSSTLSATGATSYTWSPSTQLSTTTGATVVTSTTVTRTYTVTGTSSGCSTSLPVTINVNANMFSINAISIPSVTCSGGSATLLGVATDVMHDTIESIPYNLVTQTSPTSISNAMWTGDNDEGSYSVALPFRFYFYGFGYDTVHICTNGYVTFGGPDVTYLTYTLPDASAPAPLIGLFYRDMLCPTNSVKYSVEGTAPNRRFVIYYSGIRDYLSTGTTNKGQIILYENNGNIDLLVTSTESSEKVCGVQNATGTIAVTAPSRNNVSYEITTPEAWRIYGTPNNVNYTWSPSSSLAATTGASVSTTAISSNRVFTVIATDLSSGCTSTDTTSVIIGTFNATIASSVDSVCSGSTANITITGPAGATAKYTINGSDTQTVVLNMYGTYSTTTTALTTTTTFRVVQLISGVCIQNISTISKTVVVKPTPTAISGASFVCVGGTATLTNTVPSGTWTSANPGRATIDASSGVINGVAAGNANISYSVSGCATSAVIRVVAPPAAITPTTAVSLCTGTTTTLANSVGSGEWSSSNTSIATIDIASGVVFGNNAGTVTLSYSTGCGTPATKTATVNATPTAITGPSGEIPVAAICTLSTYNFTDATSSGTWSNSPTTVGTINASGLFSSSASIGLTTISYTVGSCSAIYSFNVGSTSPAAIAGASSVCVNNTTTLTNTVSSGVWSSSNTSIATINPLNGAATGLSSGTVTISYNNGCGTPASRTFTVNGSVPILNVTPTCSGSVLSLNATVSDPGTYSWVGPNSFTSSLQNPTISSVTTNASGTYTFTTTTTIGSCTSSAKVFAVVDPAPTVTVTATPNTICSGDSVLLNSGITIPAPNAYVMYAIPYAPYSIAGGVNGPNGDDAQSLVSIPFTFNYFGTGYNSVRICTNGFINFGASSTAYSAATVPSADAPAGMIALFWHDMTATAGDIKYTTIGSAPNRKFIVNYNEVADLSGAGTNTGQIVLHEGSNIVDIFMLNSNTGGTYSMVTGVQNPSKTIAFTPPNKNNTTYTITSPGEGWRFVMPNYNFSWSPASTLSSSTVSNPTNYGLASTTTFTVTANDIYSSCIGNSNNVTVNVNPRPTAFNLTGGGLICDDFPLNIGLSGSEAGVNYQLYTGSYTVGSPVSGTGSALGLGSFTTAGTYSVVGVSSLGCTNNMTGVANITNGTIRYSLGANLNRCQPVTSANASYSIITGTPTHYNINWSAAAITAGFSNVTSAPITPSIPISIPVDVTGVYTPTITLTNGSCNSNSDSIQLNLFSTPTAAITSAIVPCAGYGTNIVFNGSPDATIAYTVNGGSIINTSLTGGSYNYPTGSITDSITVRLINAHNIACTTSIDTTATVRAQEFLWNGITSSDWNTASNWSCGVTPSASDNIIISNTAIHLPEIAAAASGICNSISIPVGSNILLQNSSVLYIKGNINSSGSINGPGKIVLNGTTTQLVSGNSSVSNIEIDNTNGVNILSGGKLNISNTIAIANGTLNTSDSLTLLSNASGTARVLPISSGSINGLVSVERYIPGGRRAYRFWGHPFSDNISLSQLMNDIDITGTGGATNGFTTTGSNSASAFWYNTYYGNSTLSYDPGWRPITSLIDGIDSNQVHQYQAIRLFIRGAKSEGLGYTSYTPSATKLTTKGNLNQGTQHIILKKGTGVGQDYNLISNPYASPIDLGTVAYRAKQSGKITGSAIYVWNPYMATSGIFQAVPIGISSAIPYNIQANAGFEVRAIANGDTLTIYETDKVNNASTGLLKMPTDYLKIVVNDSNNQIWDESYITLNEDAKNVDEEYDARKIYNDEVNLYTISSDLHMLSIDARPKGNDIEIPIGFNSNKLGTKYTFKFSGHINDDLYLHDITSNNYSKVYDGLTYTFTHMDDTKNRFKIVSKKDKGNILGFSCNVYPNPSTDILHINFNEPESNLSIRLVDVNGMTVYKNQVKEKAITIISIPMNDIASGIYLLEIETKNNKYINKVIKQ